MLKEAKSEYLQQKQHYQQLRDKFALTCIERKAIRAQCYQEKEKTKQNRLKRIFGKRKIKSIKVIKYIKDGYLIRTSEKIEME